MGKELDSATARRLAVASDTDPRTVAKVWRGERTRGMSAERARKVVEEYRRQLAEGAR